MNECSCHCPARTRERKYGPQTWHAMKHTWLSCLLHPRSCSWQSDPPWAISTALPALHLLLGFSLLKGTESRCSKELLLQEWNQRKGPDTWLNTWGLVPRPLFLDFWAPSHALLYPIPTAFLTAYSLKTQWGYYSKGTEKCCSWWLSQHWRNIKHCGKCFAYKWSPHNSRACVLLIPSLQMGETKAYWRYRHCQRSPDRQWIWSQACFIHTFNLFATHFLIPAPPCERMITTVVAIWALIMSVHS